MVIVNGPGAERRPKRGEGRGGSSTAFEMNQESTQVTGKVVVVGGVEVGVGGGDDDEEGGVESGWQEGVCCVLGL